MPKLTNEVKLCIVQHLACYDSPSEVVDSIKTVYGLNVTRQQVEAYDPTKQAGLKLQDKWKVIFDSVRDKFVLETSTIPIAHKAYRLRQMQKAHDYFTSRKNFIASSKILEQAAKEVGEIYVNKYREPPKAPGDDGNAAPKSEYVLKPDEDVPAKPIL